MTAVYTSYTEQSIPSHPGKDWTRFVCISDTHSRVFPVPDGDVLLHAGDLSSWGSFEQLQVTINWLKTLPHKTKIIVAGNHDLCLDLDRKTTKTSRLHGSAEIDAARKYITSAELRQEGIIYLENQSETLTLDNGMTWKVFGSPATPRFVRGAFQYTNKQEGAEIWARIPSDAEIVITHTPAHRVLDKTHFWTHAGCKALKERLEHLPRRRMHVFGHIHESNGAVITQMTENREFVSVNAAVFEIGKAVITDLHKSSP